MVCGVVAFTFVNAREDGDAVIMPLGAAAIVTGIELGVKPVPLSCIEPTPGGACTGSAVTRIVKGVIKLPPPTRTTEMPTLGVTFTSPTWPPLAETVTS